MNHQNPLLVSYCLVISKRTPLVWARTSFFTVCEGRTVPQAMQSVQLLIVTPLWCRILSKDSERTENHQPIAMSFVCDPALVTCSTSCVMNSVRFRSWEIQSTIRYRQRIVDYQQLTDVAATDRRLRSGWSDNYCPSWEAFDRRIWNHHNLFER